MKTLNFEKWLKSQNVDTKYFWNRCRKKNQQWTIKRYAKVRKIVKLQPRASFIDIAFNWGKAKGGYSYWNNLDTEWRNEVETYKGPVEFGFN